MKISYTLMSAEESSRCSFNFTLNETHYKLGMCSNLPWNRPSTLKLFWFPSKFLNVLPEKDLQYSSQGKFLWCKFHLAVSIHCRFLPAFDSHSLVSTQAIYSLKIDIAHLFFNGYEFQKVSPLDYSRLFK